MVMQHINPFRNPATVVRGAEAEFPSLTTCCRPQPHEPWQQNLLVAHRRRYEEMHGISDDSCGALAAACPSPSLMRWWPRLPEVWGSAGPAAPLASRLRPVESA